MASDSDIRCSFCGKHKDDVEKLIAGRPDVFICDQCIELCNGIIESDLGERAKKLTKERRLAVLVCQHVEFYQPEHWQIDGRTYIAQAQTPLEIVDLGNHTFFDGEVMPGTRLDFSDENLHLDLRLAPAGASAEDEALEVEEETAAEGSDT